MKIGKFLFQAKNAEGKIVKFDIREPMGPNAQREASHRAELICKAKNYTELQSR